MKNFRVQNIRLVDATQDFQGSLVIEAGYIKAILPGDNQPSGLYIQDDFLPGDENIALMPAFIDLHAHFRDPGFPEKETLESGSQAAAAGGYGTVVCMANTKPVIDTLELARALKDRSDALGLIDLYPALALTKGMQGKSLSAITQADLPGIRLLSEDGQDVDDDALLLQAFQEARRLGLPVSCHCAAKLAGTSQDRRIEENQGVQRVIALGKEAGCRIHIAHVSTKEAVELIRQAKETFLTCEATPHHLRLTKAEADKLGKKGRVNPPLRTEEDRQAIINGFLDGTIDAGATDHAPHTEADKRAGAPGFIGLETAFSAYSTELVQEGRFSLSDLSRILSATPARILGLPDRGHLRIGMRGDVTLIDVHKIVHPQPDSFNSKSRNSPFIGCSLRGAPLMTLHRGRIVWSRQSFFNAPLQEKSGIQDNRNRSRVMHERAQNRVEDA